MNTQHHRPRPTARFTPLDEHGKPTGQPIDIELTEKVTIHTSQPDPPPVCLCLTTVVFQYVNGWTHTTHTVVHSPDCHTTT